MSNFIKLTNFLVNTKYIQSIIVKPNTYHINVMSNKFEGTHYSIVGTGGGNIFSHNCKISLCKTKNAIDCKILSDWIDKQ